jgi:hypothetical protein
MIILQKPQIDKALPKVKNGPEKYLWLQNEVNKRNVSLDREFQRKFNAFYRVRRNKDWQKEFYKLLEINKGNIIDFYHMLVRFYDKTKKVEASFISKLVATLNPKMPIIDKIVFNNLGLSLPATYKKNRSLIINEQYKILIKEFSDYLQTDNGRYLVERFTKEYPQAKISKVKMLDLILWQTRS